LDLRATGLPDLVVSSATEGVFRILFNDGTGLFGTSRDYQVPGGPASGFGTSHLRGVDQDELMMQSSITGDVIFFPVQGGELGSPEAIHAGGGLTALTTGAFIHRSGDMDLAAIDTVKSELVVFLNSKMDVGSH
jgi:hypothetical protein